MQNDSSEMNVYIDVIANQEAIHGGAQTWVETSRIPSLVYVLNGSVLYIAPIQLIKYFCNSQERKKKLLEQLTSKCQRPGIQPLENDHHYTYSTNSTNWNIV